MAEGGRSWLRYGCFGCVGLVVLLVAVAGSLVGVAMLRVRGEQMIERQLSPAIPPASEGSSDTDGSQIDPTRSGRVVLNLRHAGFEVEAAPSGEGLSVDATFDDQAYELIERFEPGGESGWEYTIEFHRTGTGLLTGLKEALGGTQPEVQIYLPTDHALELDIDVAQGAMTGDLGGLWLSDATLVLNQGAIEMEFSRPLRAPMNELTFDVSMGGVVLESLGNASPATMAFKLSMGGGDVDLRGQWVQDSHISFDTSMGGAQVRLPRDVLIEGIDRGSLRLESEAEVKPPTLFIEVDSADLENLEFIE